MRTIWKYVFDDNVDVQDFDIPSCGYPLHFGYQNGSFCFWVEVFSSNPKVKRRFRIIGTGHEIPKECISPRYVGTTQTPPFVWHLYEEEIKEQK